MSGWLFFFSWQTEKKKWKCFDNLACLIHLHEKNSIHLPCSVSTIAKHVSQSIAVYKYTWNERKNNLHQKWNVCTQFVRDNISRGKQLLYGCALNVDFSILVLSFAAAFYICLMCAFVANDRRQFDFGHWHSLNCK